MGSLARQIARYHLKYVSYCPKCQRKLPRPYWYSRDKIKGVATMIKKCKECRNKV